MAIEATEQIPETHFSGGAKLTTSSEEGLRDILNRMKTGSAVFLGALSNTGRPDAADQNPGDWIFNTDDNAPNWSHGTNWRDATGTIT